MASQHTPHLVDTTMFWSGGGGPGGVRSHLLAKRQHLGRGRRWRHTIVAPGAQGEGLVDCGGLPLPGSGGYRWPWRRAALARLIAEQRPDIVEAGDPYRLAWAALDAARASGAVAVYFCHSDIVALASFALRTPKVEPAVARYLARLCDGFDLVLAPSRHTQRRLQQLGVGHAEHQALGVDLDVFRPEARSPSWRSDLGLPDDARVLLYAGRFAPEKNLPQLVAAVERLGAPYWLVAIGAGPQPPHGERVRVFPPLAPGAAVARALASADVFVHAGDQETGGLGAIEAMACGTPVVVCDAGALAEVAADGCGLGVPSLQPRAWADAIDAAFHGGVDVHAALERARSHDWRRVAAQLEQRYLAASSRLRALPHAA